MSLPHLLLCDDSDAILQYERATLLGHYETTFAHDGEEALALVREQRFAAILLDLSMPRMDGEQVLAALRSLPELADMPVVIVSSERDRGEACLLVGAQAYVPKPIRAEELRAAVASVLAAVQQRERRTAIALIVLDVGGTRVALPISSVRGVFHLPATQPLLAGPPYLREMIEYRGRSVAVLDLADRFGLAHAVPLIERKLVLVDVGATILALTADHVFDPEEIPRSEEPLGVGDHPPVAELVEAVARSAHGLVPLIRPEALLSNRLLTELTALVTAEPAT
jgi:CheY-like chemotaxis protein/chemotaxis signal transduction protein